jgi:type IV secretion system protein VirD4
MDEIANCGYIPDYEMKKSTMRSRGISTVEIWQNVTQLENRYRSWEELMANSDHLLFLGANELKTAELISKRLGQTTIRVHGANTNQSSNSGSSGRSETYTGRPLMTPDEVLRLPANEAILIPRGTYPATIQKADYEEHSLADEIEWVDHKDYEAPDRPPLEITDVAKLWSATQKRAPQPEQPRGTAQPAVDPLDFLDSEHKPKKAKQEEDSLDA